MIYTLTGSNTFLLKQELVKLRTSFVDEHGDFDLEHVDAERLSVHDLAAKLSSLPFFSKKKCLIIDRPSADNSLAEALPELTDTVSDSVDVILIEPSLDKRTRYYKYLKKHTDFREFSDLDEVALTRWLLAEANELGARLSNQDAKYLIARVGANQYGLYNELRKLTTYSQEITTSIVDLLSEPTPQTSIFDLLDSAFSGNTQRALQLYEDQRAQKVEPQIILVMLARQMHTMALILTAPSHLGDTVIAKENNLHPYAVKKARSSVRRMSLTELMHHVTELRDIDRRQKTKNISLDDALKYFLVSLAQ